MVVGIVPHLAVSIVSAAPAGVTFNRPIRLGSALHPAARPIPSPLTGALSAELGQTVSSRI